MSKSDELVNYLSKLIEKGILNSQDIRKEIITGFKFKRDKAINYGRVLEIMGMLSGSGFTKVALISEPNKER